MSSKPDYRIQAEDAWSAAFTPHRERHFNDLPPSKKEMYVDPEGYLRYRPKTN